MRTRFSTSTGWLVFGTRVIAALFMCCSPLYADVAIKGFVRDSGNGAAIIATLTATPGGYNTTSSGSDGSYTLWVPYGWAGRVTPTNPNYTSFNPWCRDYPSVVSTRWVQNYWGSNQVPIKGFVRDSGNSAIVATLTANPGGYSTTSSGSDGSYTLWVPYGWAGRVTPTKPNYTFKPWCRDYPSVVSTRWVQNYYGSYGPQIVFSDGFEGIFPGSWHVYTSEFIIFSDDFEGSFPGSWYVGNNNSNTVAKWGDNYAKAYGGSWSAFCADNGSNSRTTYDNNLNTYMQRRNVSLVGYNNATLTFKYWMNTEGNYDTFQVNVRNQSGTWANLMTISGNQSGSGWQTKTLSMNQYAGQTGLIVSLDFVSDASYVPSGAAGVWVDDVKLTGNGGAQWGDNYAKAYSGSWSAFCADNGSNSRTTYDNHLNTYMQRENVSLAGYNHATLTFKYWMNTETNYDFFYVRVKDQAGNWAYLLTLSGNSSGWQPKTLPMDQYAGQTGLTVQFLFYSDASYVPSGAAGVWVDDVLLTASTSLGTGTASDKQPAHATNWELFR